MSGVLLETAAFCKSETIQILHRLDVSISRS